MSLHGDKHQGGRSPSYCAVMALIGAWMVSCPTGVKAASTTQGALVQRATQPAVMAYCGIRCLYAAALVDGVTFAATDLVKPEYVGSREGSSIEELELAAQSRGLHTFAFVNGTADSLRLSVHPVILHVESVPGSGKYDHFVLCLGTRGGNFLVLDTMLPPERIKGDVDDF